MASSSSSSSSTKQKWIYDVFLSFRGEDTRNNITSHINTALTQAGILTFMDDTELRRGTAISPSSLQAIEGSRIAVIIFSQNYPFSSWCLDELVKIMECQRTLGQLVIPVFYNVEPSHVRHINWLDGFRRWRTALIDATNLSGYDFSNYRNESELVKELVRDVSEKLDSTLLFVADHPVGIESRVHELAIELLKEGSQNVLIIGIWGMGGSGKTTLANLQ